VKNKKKAKNSSGSSIDPALRLFICMRIMKGETWYLYEYVIASYLFFPGVIKGAKQLDFSWMSVDSNHAWDDCWRPVAEAIDEALDNVKFDGGNAEWVHAQQNQWAYV
jgi:hypothetical protein